MEQACRLGIDAYPLSNPPTGIGNYLEHLLEALLEVRTKDLFYLYAPKTSPLLKKWEVHRQVRLRINPSLSFSEALWSQTTLPWLISQDALDVFWGPAQSLPLWLPAKVKTLLTIHDFAYHLYPATVSTLRSYYLKLGGGFFYRKADLRIVNSLGTGEKLQALYNLPYHLHLPPSVKIERKKAVKKEHLLLIATLEPRKNLLSLLTCYEGFLKNYPHLDWSPLVLVGKKGWKCTEVCRQIDRLTHRYPDHFTYLGYVEKSQLTSLLAEAKFLLLCSLYEGYGMPLAEARSVGTPVIAFDQPEMREAAEGDGLFIKELEELFPLLQKKAVARVVGKISYPTTRSLAELFSQNIDHLIGTC